MTQAIIRHKVMLRPRSMPFFARSLVDMAKGKLRGSESAFRRGRGSTLARPLPHQRRSRSAWHRRRHGPDAGWQDWLTNAQSPGCYLQTLVENIRAT